MDNCVFCKIIKGDIPSYKVYEDESSFAFLDIRPIKEGHTMIVPKTHFSYLFEMPDDEYISLLSSAKKVAAMLKKVFKPKSGKVGEIVYGLDVDHVHIHLVPIDKSGDLSFVNAKPVSGDQLVKAQRKITT